MPVPAFDHTDNVDLSHRRACVLIQDGAARDRVCAALHQLGFQIAQQFLGSAAAMTEEVVVADLSHVRSSDVPNAERRSGPPTNEPIRVALLSLSDAAAFTALDTEYGDAVVVDNLDPDLLRTYLSLAINRAVATRKRIETALASAVRQTQELSLLHQVRTALGGELELPVLFRRVVEATAATFGYSLVSVYLLEDEEALVLQHQVGYGRQLERIPITRGVIGRVARTGRPALIVDVAAESEFLAAMPGIQSEICVPFFEHGRVAGALNVESSDSIPLTDDDLRLLTAIGDHLSLAVDRTYDFATARASETRLRLAVEAVEMGTWDWDTVTGEVRWSEQMGPLYGLPAGTPHLTSAEWYTLIHPDDRAIIRRADDEAIQFTHDYDVEFRVVHPHTEDVRWLVGRGRVVERGPNSEATRIIGVTMDITARKRLEEERLQLAQAEAARSEAEETQRKLTDVLERITASFVALDPEWNITYLNQRAGYLLQQPREEVLGQDFWRIFPFASAPEVSGPLRQAMAEQTPESFDAFLSRGHRWIEVHAYPAPDGLSIYLQDVTERKRAEEDLRTSEGRFRSLVLNASDVILILDRRGVVRYASPAIERIIGVADVEIVGSDNLFRVHPDDASRLRRAFVRARNVQGVSPPIELRFRHRDGSWRWIEVTATNLFNVPGVDGIVANCRDITERRQVEDDLRFLADTSELLAGSLDTEATLATLARQVVAHLADWCVVDAVDENGGIRDYAVAHVDPEMERQLAGLRKRRPINPQSPTGPGLVLRTGEPQLYPVMDDDLQRQHVDNPAALEVFRAIGFRSGVVVPLIARSMTIGVLSFVSRIPGRFGNRELALAQDLARRAALAMDNARLYRESQEAIAARDQFLSLAAHELRTPITAIGGFSELLRREVDRGADPARTNRFVSRLIDAGQRLSSLVEDMLDVSRIRLGQLPLRLQPLDVSGLLERIAAAYREQQTGAKHRVVVQLPNDQCQIVADGDRIEQVLANLLDNAVKYSPNGGDIRIRLDALPDAIRISVSDRGIGLPSDALESVFAPFGRGANAMRGHMPGLGLGLFICRNIVERHGGRIWADSRGEGTGTTLTVWLPRRDEEITEFDQATAIPISFGQRDATPDVQA